MCILRAREVSSWTLKRLALELLALLAQPGGKRREDALNLGARLISWTNSENSSFQHSFRAV